MKVTVEKIDNHKRVLEIEVPQTEVAKAVNKAFAKLANEISIPGFRKGKAPRKILEMKIGKEAVLDEAFEIMATPAYVKALDEHGVDPVSRPEIDVVTLAEDQPLVFKATVVVKPEVELGEYKKVSVPFVPEEVTEEAVNAKLESLRERHAKMIVVENAQVQNNDFAIIDFEGFVDGVPFEGGESKGYPLMVGSGTFIPGFEEQLIGLSTGDEKDVTVTFPKEYHAEALAGKDAIFKVKVNDIKRKELPVIDDEFAKEVSEFDSLEEFKADLKNKLEESAKQKAESDFRNAAIQKAMENATVDVPEIMVENRIDDMLQDLDMNLRSRGSSLEQFLTYTKMDMAGLRTKQQETAVGQVKIDLMLEAVAKKENLAVTEADIQQEIAEMAKSYQVSEDEVRKAVMGSGSRLGAINDAVLRRKAAELILAGAVKE